MLKQILRRNLLETRVKPDEIELIHRDNDFIVLRPLSFRASCKYGANTHWCTSTPSNRDKFDSHTSGEKYLIYILNRKTNPTAVINYERFEELDNKIRGKGGSEQEEKEYEELWEKMRETATSRIAIHVNPIGYEMFGADNLPLDERYETVEDLPVSSIVIDKINDYMESHEVRIPSTVFKEYEKELRGKGFEVEFIAEADDLIVIQILQGREHEANIMNKLTEMADRMNVVLQLKPSVYHSRSEFFYKFGFTPDRNSENLQRIPK